MPWIDPLDKLPQAPRDWANHIVYGAVLGVIGFLFARHLGVQDPRGAALFATAGVATAKKTADFLVGHEPWQVCVGKVIATIFVPLLSFIY